jgi:hypothetical protein
MRLHPYRSAARTVEPERPDAKDASGRALAAAQTFLLGWSLIRAALCAVRGLDLEGLFAVVLVVTTALALAVPSRLESSS